MHKRTMLTYRVLATHNENCFISFFELHKIKLNKMAEVTNEHMEVRAKAVKKAMSILKKGDRVRCIKCPGTERTFTFSCWDGPWMVSKSGINDYHPFNITKINGIAISFRP